MRESGSSAATNVKVIKTFFIVSPRNIISFFADCPADFGRTRSYRLPRRAWEPLPWFLAGVVALDSPFPGPPWPWVPFHRGPEPTGCPHTSQSPSPFKSPCVEEPSRQEPSRCLCRSRCWSVSHVWSRNRSRLLA